MTDDQVVNLIEAIRDSFGCAIGEMRDRNSLDEIANAINRVADQLENIYLNMPE